MLLLKAAFLKIILLHQKRKYQSDPILSGVRSDPQSDPIQAIRSGSIRVLLTASPGCYSTPTPATNVSVKSKLQHPPPGIPRAFDTFAVPRRREFDYQSLPGGGEFELNPRFHVKSLVWRAIIGDAVLEDFRGKDRAFVANWFRGKGLNKLCAVFEVFKF